MPESDTHVGFARRTFSDAGSTPAASTKALVELSRSIISGCVRPKHRQFTSHKRLILSAKVTLGPGAASAVLWASFRLLAINMRLSLQPGKFVEIRP